MTGTWQLLRSIDFRLIREAKTLESVQDKIWTFISRRYSEHEADTAKNQLKSLGFRAWKQWIASEYMNSDLNDLVDDFGKTAAAVHRARKELAGSGEEEGPGAAGVVGSSGRQYMSPEDAEERQARIDAMRQARGAPAGGKTAAQTLMTPGRGGGHAVGTAGQHRTKQQPSVAAGFQPQRSAAELKKMRTSKSGVVRAQRNVDRETREKGIAAGEKLAQELGVPTTAERTIENPDTGEKTIQVWGPDRVLKHTDIDVRPLPGLSTRQPRVTSMAGGDVRGAKTDAERLAQAQRSAKFASAGIMDPERLEKIKRGILRRNRAPSKVGPDRSGSFHGERWKPHGREEEIAVSRPDLATGKYVRGSMMQNPASTGQEVIWNKYDQEWQQPSVFSSREAERGAKMKAGAAEPEPSGDFEDDEKTDPGVPTFDED